MAFISQNNTDKHYKVTRQHLLNTQGFTREYCISDANKVTPYQFSCPVCKTSSTKIISSNARWIESIKIQLDWEAIKALGGTGDMGNVMTCDTCHTPYFIGIGYAEPNYGRDVFFVHTIIELKEISDKAKLIKANQSIIDVIKPILKKWF